MKISGLALTATYALVSLVTAQDSISDPKIVGTWTTKSFKVFTGPVWRAKQSWILKQSDKITGLLQPSRRPLYRARTDRNLILFHSRWLVWRSLLPRNLEPNKPKMSLRNTTMAARPIYNPRKLLNHSHTHSRWRPPINVYTMSVRQCSLHKIPPARIHEIIQYRNRQIPQHTTLKFVPVQWSTSATIIPSIYTSSDVANSNVKSHLCTQRDWQSETRSVTNSYAQRCTTEQECNYTCERALWCR